MEKPTDSGSNSFCFGSCNSNGCLKYRCGESEAAICKAEGTALPANIVEVGAGKTVPGSIIPGGQCWVWVAQRSTGNYPTWPWRKFGPFQLTGGSHYVLAFSGNVAPSTPQQFSVCPVTYRTDTQSMVKLKQHTGELASRKPFNVRREIGSIRLIP